MDTKVPHVVLTFDVSLPRIYADSILEASEAVQFVQDVFTLDHLMKRLTDSRVYYTDTSDVDE